MLKKLLKVVLGILLGLVGLFMAAVIIVMIIDSKPSSSSTPPINQEIESIDVEKRNELKLYNETFSKTPISLSYQEINDFKQLLKTSGFFSYSDAYGIDEALQLYRSLSVEKSKVSNLLDEHGQLDRDLLMDCILENNEVYMNQGQDAINVFYSEMDLSDMSAICDKIVEVVNAQFLDIEISKVANTLSKLKMFEKTGSASNAYVTDDLTFVFNPTMTSMYGDMQAITGRDENTKDSVIVHEVMHLLQYAASDLKDDNGIEAGFCRMYNVPNQDDLLKVDSLWYPWILEASAELGMAKYLDVEPGTYQKKISYLNSYNLSLFNENVKLEEDVFQGSLNDYDEETLKFMYSVEITQSDPDDFWESYNESLSSDEMLEIRMKIRTEAVNYLTHQFYRQLMDAIQEGKVNDLETIFYLIRTYEMDAFSHLAYNTKDSLEVAKPYIEEHYHLQEALFEALETDFDTYRNYYLQVSIDGEPFNHCDLSHYDERLINYKNGYATSNFCLVCDVYDYLNI